MSFTCPLLMDFFLFSLSLSLSLSIFPYIYLSFPLKHTYSLFFSISLFLSLARSLARLLCATIVAAFDGGVAAFDVSVR